MTKRCTHILASLVFACGLACTPEPEPPVATIEALQLSGATERRYDFSDPQAWTDWDIEAGDWTLQTNAEGTVLLQRQTDQLFCWAYAPEPRMARDVDVSVRFRPISGAEDASGGIAIRGDGDRYLVVRGNGLEHNFRAYLHERGRRSVVAGTSIAPIAIGEWHELRVVAIERRVQAWLDGELLLDFETDLTLPGRVGLWTKADAVTEFSALVLRYIES